MDSVSVVATALVVSGFVMWIYVLIRDRAGRATALRQCESQINEYKTLVAIKNQQIEGLQCERNNLATAVDSLRSECQNLGEDLAGQKVLYVQACQQIDEAAKRSSAKDADLCSATEKIEVLKLKISELEVKNSLVEEANRRQPEAIKQMLADASASITKVTNDILDSKSKAFDAHALENMGATLDPLKEKIAGFEKFVKETAGESTRDISALKGCLELLTKGAEKISNTTEALEKVFRGNSKFRGNYGELVLDRVLEVAGLVEGREYEKQVPLKTEAGSRSYPDVIVQFSESRKVVVDSKVSLIHWESYNLANSDQDRAAAGQAHVKAVMKHVDDLAQKEYSTMIGCGSPDFVLMFMPIETAYLLALEHEPNIQAMAAAKRVIIVVPSTLIVSLKMAANYWVQERQTKNAMKIATEAGKLYDKFAGLTADLEDISKTFERGSGQVASAFSKLKSGPGNVFRKMDELVRLGAAPKRVKRLDPLLVEANELEEEYVETECDLQQAPAEGLKVAPVAAVPVN